MDPSPSLHVPNSGAGCRNKISLRTWALADWLFTTKLYIFNQAADILLSPLKSFWMLDLFSLGDHTTSRHDLFYFPTCDEVSDN